MKFVTAKDLIAQLKNDLIGKDSYRGVTLTYSWLANQFGHFSLGFIPTILIYTLLKAKTSVSSPELWAAFGVWGGWILFELFNFLWPLLFKSESKRKALGSGKYTFQPAWLNVTFDTITDLLYFGIGALSASLICEFHQGILITLIVLVILISYPFYYWYSTKMFIQNAGYPFQLRLSQWNQQIKEENKALILNFLQHNEPGKHMLLFGSRGSGKTMLSVGIATESSIKNNSCSYVTAVKLLCLFFENEDNPPITKPGAWSWRNSSLLVIDDINPGGNVQDDILSAAQFYTILDNLSCGEINKKAIKEKSIIWVMGNEDPDRHAEERWETLLEKIGVEKSNITTVNLDAI
ncbi:ATP-binding protein [Pedobacter ginsengisoli]|uniref:ATP-binding protein n=1 Tax=Pedobacter ginsengisoli TaxID=363852 RepID=A0A2D1UBK0_9SPHI|nr:ATP-binding protein [Pedobacter ginsengisoli]ATP58973.1 ATP-binding protein [Pedobacter ginsengisoli]